MSNTKISMKDAVAKIKKLLFDAVPADPAAVADPTGGDGSTPYTLSDGTNIKVLGELAEGSQVVVVTADGETPIPDGDYTLSDGTTLSCVGGAITEVSAKSEDNAEGDMEMKAKMAEQEKQISQLAGAMKTIADAVNILQTGFKAQQEAFTETLTLVENLGDASATEPVQKPQNAFSKKVNETERMTELAAALKKIKESK